MTCEVKTENRPPDLQIRTRTVFVRERVLRYLLGEKIQTAIIVPEHGVSRMILVSDEKEAE